MIEKTLWHPVAAQAELADAPLAVTVLGHALVLWRDDAGAAHAFTDRCPHRGTPLSLGRVHEGRLECAYHGWQFEGGGRCMHIPAVPGFVAPHSHAAGTHELHAAHGLWWVRLANGNVALPALDDLPARQVVCGPYDVATSAPRVVENFLDTSHFAFVHEGSLGDRGHTVVPDYDVVNAANGAPEVPHYRAWQPRASAAASAGTWVDYRYRVLSPYSALLLKHAAVAEAYALWVCPLAPETSRVWFTIFTDDLASSDAQLRAFQHQVFMQDRPVLEAQRPRALPLHGGGEVHSAADRLSTAYRRWLRTLGITFGVC